MAFPHIFFMPEKVQRLCLNSHCGLCFLFFFHHQKLLFIYFFNSFIFLARQPMAKKLSLLIMKMICSFGLESTRNVFVICSLSYFFFLLLSLSRARCDALHVVLHYGIIRNVPYYFRSSSFSVFCHI